MTRADVFAYAEKQYGTVPEYPWHEYPDYAVLRHSDDAKWYGLVMNVPKDRLGMEGAEEVDIINLKAQPDEISALRNDDGFLPAYHMNKEHWISVLLNAAHDEQVFALIDESFSLTEPRSGGRR